MTHRSNAALVCCCAALVCVLARSIMALGPRSVVNNPTPELSLPWRPILDNMTTISRHETVTEWAFGGALGHSAEVQLKWLSSNLMVPSFGDRVQYHSNEGETEIVLPIGKAGSITAAASGFASRYWLDTQDGAGSTLSLTRTFLGPKLLLEAQEERLRPSIVAKGMIVEERAQPDHFVSALGLGLRALLWREFGHLEAVGEWNPFLNNPLHYRRAWGGGLRWIKDGGLSLGIFASNTYGALSPDSFFGSAFTQYRFQWSYVF